MRSTSVRRRTAVIAAVAAVVAVLATALVVLTRSGDRAAGRPRPLPRPPARGYARNAEGRLAAQWITALGFDPVDVAADRDGIVVEGFAALAALDRNGHVQWRAELHEADSRTPALIGDGVVVGDDSTIVAFSRDHGRPRWRVPVPGGIHEMDVVRLDGRAPMVVVATRDGAVLAIDGTTGAPRWRVTGPGGVIATGASGRGDVLVVGWTDASDGPRPGGVTSLDPETGATRWRVESLPFATVPVVVRDRVVVAQCTSARAADGELIGLDARTGVQRWTASTGGVFHSKLWAAVDGANVYVPDGTGRVVALDAATGQRGWVSPRYVASFWITRAVIGRDTVMVPARDGVLPVVGLDDGRLRARRAAYGDVIGVARAPGDHIVLAVRGPKPHVLAFDRRRFEALAAGRPR